VAGNAQIIVDFVANLSGLTKGAQDVEKAGKAAGKGLDWKGVAKWTAGAAAVGAAAGYLVKSTKATADLAKATMSLQRATGLDTTTASEWVLLLQQRGIQTDAFARSMLTLSKAMEKWRTAGAAAPSVLKDLGVSFDAVQKGDVGAVLQQVSDGLAKIENPAQKAAAASKLFGKASTALLPVLGQGSKAMNASLKATDKYGAALSGDTLKAVQDQTKAQRELAAMQAGVATTIGAAVLPVQAELFGVLVDILGVATPLLQNSTAMKGAVIAAAVAYAAYKVAVVAASVAGAKETVVGIAKSAQKAAEAVAVGVAEMGWWGYAAAQLAAIGPTLLIIAAIAAVIVIAVLLWKNWDTVSAALGKAFQRIKDAALAVWNWIRANWPLLLAILAGPIGLAVLAIARHWSSITSAARAAFDAVKSTISAFASWISSTVTTIGQRLSSLAAAFDKPADAARDAAAAVKSAIGKIPGYIEDIVGRAGAAASSVANAIKRPINAVLGAFNSLRFTIPSIPIPKINLPGGGSVGGGSVGGSSIGGFHVPLLAAGGVLERPTLFIGGEKGREIVTPEKLLRDIVGEQGRGDTFNLYLQPRTADAADVAYGFRRLELLRTGR
jgi:hypothetical protein